MHLSDHDRHLANIYIYNDHQQKAHFIINAVILIQCSTVHIMAEEASQSQPNGAHPHHRAQKELTSSSASEGKFGDDLNDQQKEEEGIRTWTSGNLLCNFVQCTIVIGYLKIFKLFMFSNK